MLLSKDFHLLKNENLQDFKLDLPVSSWIFLYPAGSSCIQLVEPFKEDTSGSLHQAVQ
jgi:hypothetical protein